MTILDRLFGRPATKAAFGPGVSALMNLPPLSVMGGSQQERMAQYLKAYKVGWFYKAERKISNDFASLKVTLSPEDAQGENQTELVSPDLFSPLATLSPVDQFLRLMESPNPSQTGRALRQKTQIRIDMAGAAFWYLERPDAVYGLPTAIYGVSPTRMWPSYDSDGRLIGWVLDHDARGGGVPFTTDEILPFITGSADDTIWGVGVVEAVYAEVPLTDLMSKHTADVLLTGGRMAGAMWPKDRALSEPEFQDAQRAWRNVVSDPNSAKRLLLFPEPMEYAAGASTPAEIGIPELAALNRDNILTAFPIDPVMLGVPAANGLGGGEERRWQRREYWEGTIHPRVEMFEEVIQTGLVSRYERAIGGSLDFDVEEPSLDDAPTLIEKAGAMSALVNLGFDPKEVAAAAGLDHLKYTKPAPQEPADTGEALQIKVGDTTRRDESQTTARLAKAVTRTTRDDVTVPAERRAAALLTSFFADQRARVVSKLQAVWPSTKAARKDIEDDDWWDAEAEAAALSDVLATIYATIGRGATQVVADTVDRIVTPNVSRSIINSLLAAGGTRITEITETTRQAIVAELSTGISRGYSLSQIIDGYATEKYAGITNVLLENGALAWGDLRAETIARTETMLAYNEAALRGYGQYGVERVVAIDGDKDDECARRDGQEFSIDDAYSIADHPNGTLDWVPVTKAVRQTPPDAPQRVQIDISDQRIPPVVNVSPTPVTIDTLAFTNAIRELKAELTKPPRAVTKELIRNAAGVITGLREVPEE